MSDFTEDHYYSKEKKVVKQQVKGYVREVALVEFVCACPNCSQCRNIKVMAHPNRKWCSKEAMLEARRKKRMKQAIDEGRVPGKVGRPTKEPLESVLYVLRVPNTDFYKIGWSRNRDIYQRDFERNYVALPDGIEEVFSVDSPVSEEYIDFIYERFEDRIVNGDWLEFSEDDIDELKKTIQLERSD